MRALPITLLILAVAAFLLSPGALAEEKKPGNGGKEGGGESPAKPPAEPPAKPVGPSPDEVWQKVSKDLVRGSYAQKRKAVDKLCAVAPQAGLAPILAKGVMACKGYPELQVILAKRLTSLVTDPEAETWVVKVAGAEAAKRKNASSELLAIYVAFLIKKGKEQALGMAEGALPLLDQPGHMFSVLFDSGKAEFIEVVGRFAVDKKNPPVSRRLAIDYLGKWWNSPPLFKARIPYLIKAMEVRETTEEARRAIWNLCLPRHKSSKRWRKWWETYEPMKDTDIIWGTFEDAYVRVSGSKRKRDGAKRISEYIEPWNNEMFSWAVPLLHRILLEFRDKELLGNVLYTLGKIKNPASMDSVLKLRTLPSGASPDIMRQIAKCVGNIAPRGDQRAGTALMEMWGDTLNTRVRIEIIRALGSVADVSQTKAVDLLVDLMKQSTGDRKDWYAVEALGNMKALKALPAMIEVFQATQDKDKKLYILRALRTMKVRTEEVFKMAVVSLDAKDFRLQDAAIEILAGMKDERSIPNLELVFETAKRLKTRLAVLDALSGFPPDKVFTIFIKALKTHYKDPHAKDNGAGGDMFKKKHTLNPINKKAVEYFEKDNFKNLIPEMLDPLLDMLKDGKSKGRLKALQWIGHGTVWKESATSVMISLFTPREDDAIVQASVKNLIAHPSKDAFSGLVKRLSGGHPNYAWVDYQTAFVLRSYVQGSNLADPNNLLDSFDGGTDKRKWTGWWRKNKSKIRFNSAPKGGKKAGKKPGKKGG